MSAPSSPRELAPVLLALPLILCGAVGCKPRPPERDPAKFAAIGTAMIKNIPTLGAPECTGEQVIGGATLTMRTLLQITKTQYEELPERDEFVNPPELDVPAARVLVDPKASETDRRRAAAELAAAPFYLVYMIDHIDVPLALGVKELKRGFVGARALKYDKKGNLQCVRVFQWENDKQISDAAIAKCNKAAVPPDVSKSLRDDLRVQMLKRVAALGAPPPVGTEMAEKPPSF
jgi:hypothetical protein